MIDLKPLANALRETLIAKNEPDPANIADGLFEIARAVRFGLKWLGNADASTPMGALEALGDCVLRSGESIANALERVAEALERQS